MSQVWKERLQCLGEGVGLAGLRDPCQLVRQLVGSGGRSFLHFDDEHLQILPAEHETKTWRSGWLRQRHLRATTIHSPLLSY